MVSSTSDTRDPVIFYIMKMRALRQGRLKVPTDVDCEGVTRIDPKYFRLDSVVDYGV